MTRPLQSAWVELLRPVPFQWFGTYTFDRLRRLHPEAVHKKMRLLVNITNEELWGRTWRFDGPGIGSLIALEPHKDDRTHVHALHYHPEISKENPEHRKLVRSLWIPFDGQRHRRSLREGLAKVLPAADDAAAGYCAKGYATKGADLWIDDALFHWMKKRPWQPSLDLAEVANG